MKYDVLAFAKNELDKYLDILSVKAEIELEIKKFDVEDPYFDDVYSISVKDKKGVIAGSNGRSVLMGVYRLLKEWGIDWVRPGPNGTHYPEKCNTIDVELNEKADIRLRTMCTEGALKIENVTDMIEWLPKVGFNSYYIQDSLCYMFFKTWYTHIRSSVKEAEPFEFSMVDEFFDTMVREVKRRGLLLQRKGHGWNMWPFGIPDTSYSFGKKDAKVPEGYVDLCAMLDGERILFRGNPSDTQLCYSNPFVRKTMADAAIKYAEDNPEVDILHFWLSDWYNNTCECEACAEGRYSDHYIRIVNDITDGLKERGIKTKLVFCIGFNVSHPPVLTEVHNPENTILMWAPICRTFAESFPSEFRDKEICEYKINTFTKPLSVDENLTHLYAWEQVYKGDALDYDYHLMWDHMLDASNVGISRIIHKDMQNLSNLGMNGFITCQLQRNACPTPLGMTVMARTLWDKTTDFEEVRREVYTATYGEEAVEELTEYFNILEKGFDIGSIRSQKSVDREAFKADVVAAMDAMDKFKEVIEKYGNCKDACHKYSWEILEMHRQIYSLLAKAIYTKLCGDNETGDKIRDEAIHLADIYEDKLQPVFDCHFFNRMTTERIELDGLGEFVGQ